MIQQNGNGQLRVQAPKTLLHAAMALTLMLFVTAGLTAVAISHAPAAFACSLTPDSNHCHSQVQDNTGHNNGVAGSIYFTCLHSPNGSDFVTNEFWNATGGSGAYWIETGVIDGYSSKTRSWFWADVTPSSSFNAYFPPGFREAAYSTYYPAEIQYASPQTWLIYGGDSDVQMVTVHDEPNNTIAGTAGTEFSDQTGMRDSGSVSELESANSNDVWNFWGRYGNHPEQDGPNNHITPSYDNGTSTVSWSDC